VTYVDFVCSHLCTLQPAFQICIRDLRSAVVREACVTTAYVLLPLQSGYIVIMLVIITGRGEPLEVQFLFQRISVLIQRFNSVLFHKTFPVEDDADT